VPYERVSGTDANVPREPITIVARIQAEVPQQTPGVEAPCPPGRIAARSVAGIGAVATWNEGTATPCDAARP